MMVRHLNNKGLTAIEVLVCFALVSVIILSMFNVVNNYKDKETIESYKTSITTYKTTLTKAIYDDIINNGGIKSVSSSSTGCNSVDNSCYNFTNTLNITYSNEKQSTISVNSTTMCDVGSGSVAICTDATSDKINSENSSYYVGFTSSSSEIEKFSLPSIYYLRFHDVYANATDNNFIRIHIGLWHPDLGTQYDALNIVTPNVSTYPGMLG